MRPVAVTEFQYPLLLAPGHTSPRGHSPAPVAGTDHITYTCMCMHTHLYTHAYAHADTHTHFHAHTLQAGGDIAGPSVAGPSWSCC